jgi:hypothetical protein
MSQAKSSIVTNNQQSTIGLIVATKISKAKSMPDSILEYLGELALSF